MLGSKQEELAYANHRLRELSLSAVRLAKRVVGCEDILAKQQQRWLGREGELL